MYTIHVTTNAHTQLKEITYEIEKIVKQSNVKNGLCVLFVPHTTGCITINENADPDVCIDFTKAINELVPWDNNYRHFEGNSAAHLKASMIGFHETLIIENGELALGTWQGIYFVEFDGPRHRSVYVKIIEC